MNTYADKIENIQDKIVEFSNGVKVFNSCNHAVTFQDGDKPVSVPQGYLINADFKETPHSEKGAATIVRFKPVPREDNEQFLKWFYEQHPDVLVVGSQIAANAYPGYVYVMTPEPGYERVRDGQKRKSIHKFTTFAEVG